LPRQFPSTRAALDRLATGASVPPALASALLPVQSVATQAHRTEQALTNNAILRSQSYSYEDPETNTRVRLGLQTDGSWGIIVWDSDGVIQFRQTGDMSGGFISIPAPGSGGGTEAPEVYHHAQGVASASWVIDHNLGGYPIPTVISSTGDAVEGEYDYPTNNRLIITFAGAQSGDAYLPWPS